MSELVECKKCKAKIADDADACPKCGGKTNFNDLSNFIYWIIVIAAIWYFDLLTHMVNFFNSL